MLEHIPNNSMYTTIPPSFEETDYSDEDIVDYNFEPIDTRFVEEEEKELENLLKHEPRG